MTSSIEKKLNINVIITMSITIFAIIVAILSLNGIINKLVDFKKTNMKIAVNILKIAEMNLEKQSMIKDIILNHNDKQYVKKISQKYHLILKKMNSTMSLTEKLIGQKSVSEKFGDLYIKLYKAIVKNTNSEKSILKEIHRNDFSMAMKEFKIKAKKYNTEIDEITDSIYSIAISDTREVDSFEKGHFLIIIILNVIAFLIFILISSLTLSKISKHLAKLHSAAKNIRQGNLEDSIEQHSNDEIGDLTRALDRLRQSFNKSNKMINRKKHNSREQ